ncbi:20193_t:CDS:2 [Racocetra fulgida]|uniref:20193_t:CDS:1 n=1 Tax=Racocetra fulgida TaxID=60492 RepID=A0A9N8W492_9GLOM|nr:20193_t:CDS:2 [Racocetra fulgida]
MDSENSEKRQIFCLVLGEAIRKSFPVDIDKNMTVGHLKTFIMQNMNPAYTNFTARDLELWKVNIPITIENIDTKIYEENLDEYKGVRLLPNATMKIVFDEEFENSNIRIIADPEESEEGRDGLMVISPKRLKWIIEFVENKKVTLLRSPPSSGKSTLGQMLRDYFGSLNYDSIYISLAAISGGPEIYDRRLFDNFWKKQVDFTWTEISIYKKIVYVFIDEIQVIYGNGAPFFWGSLKQLLSSESCLQNIRIILLGTYHPTLDPQVTPMEIHNTLGLNALLLTWDEVQQLITNYIQRHATLGSPNFNIPEPVQKAIFNLTGGHPGLCRFILTALRNQFRENGNAMEMLRFLASSSLRDSILGIARAFHWIRDWNITEEESEFIRRKLLYQSNAPFHADYVLNPVVKKFVKIGLFSTVGPNEQMQFSAPIMRVIPSHYLFTAPIKLGPSPTRTFDEFLMRTIELMSAYNLHQSLGNGCGNNSYLYERSWQMEWYRTATTVVPVGTSISADVGAVFGSVGFLDFYVNGEHCWGVELTREGNRLNEHATRFEIDGTYNDIPLKQWAILDFRHHSKKRDGFVDVKLCLQDDNM